MSLLVWLPLLGNLENQGASVVTATNNGAIVDTAGKIGSCYSFDGIDDFLTLNNFNPNGWSEISISAWVYPTATFDHLFLFRGSGAHRFKINSSGVVFRDTNNTETQRTIALGQTIPTDVWTHITCVYKCGEIWIYQNGIQTAHSSTYYNATSTLLNDLNEYRIARAQSSSGNGYYTGKINDFRIYDHALSAAEVHEISQGLVLHYKLDGYNLFNYNTLTHDIYVLSNGNTSTSGAVDNWCLTDYIPVFPSTSYIGYNLVNGGNGNPSICFYDKNKTYTRGQAITANTPLSIMTTDTEYYVRISVRKANNDINKMLFIELPLKIIDSSGYGHNGTILGSPIISSDTARYTSSTNFPANADGILSTYPIALWNNAFTYSFWIKPSNENGGQSIYAASYNGTSCSIEKTTGNKLRFYWNGSPDLSTSSLVITDDIWQHIAIVKEENKTTVKCYYNGVLKDTFTNTFSDKTFSGNLRIARDTREDATSYTGMMSDFRIYCTALSADDIKSLYEMGGKIDNKQNLHIYEAVEMQSAIKLTKQGQMKAGEFQEATDTKLYKIDQIIETNNLIEL